MSMKNSRFLQGTEAEDKNEPTEEASSTMCSCFNKKKEEAKDQEGKDAKNGGLETNKPDQGTKVEVCEIEAIEKWFKEQKERAANTKLLEGNLYGAIEGKL